MRHQEPTWAQPVGYVGMVMILAAYAASAAAALSHGVAYHTLNLIGSLLMAQSCWWRAAWPPFALNIAWAAIAATTLGMLTIGA